MSGIKLIQNLDLSEKLPFEKVYEIIKEYEFCTVDKFEREFQYKLKEFSIDLLHRMNAIKDESNFKLSVQTIDSTTHIIVGNMFTACLLFGYSVPFYYVSDNPSNVTMKDGNEITRTHNNEIPSYTLSPEKIKIAHWIVDDKEEIVREPDPMQKLFDSIKDDIGNLSIDELRIYSQKFGGSKFNFIYDEIKRRELIKLEQFRIDNPGVPDDAIEIKLGVHYSGDADGDFEVRTINQKLWFIPKTSCCNFYEHNI